VKELSDILAPREALRRAVPALETHERPEHGQQGVLVPYFQRIYPGLTRRDLTPSPRFVYTLHVWCPEEE